MTSIYSLWTY